LKIYSCTQRFSNLLALIYVKFLVLE